MATAVIMPGWYLIDTGDKGNNPYPFARKCRGVVVAFTASSRRRLLQKLGTVRRDVLPLFVTLTYPDLYPDAKTAKSQLRALFERMRRRYPSFGAVWRIELQRRGAPHYHLLVWGVPYDDFRDWLPRAWYEIAGYGDSNHLAVHQGRLGNRPSVERVKSWGAVMAYASKYVAKPSEILQPIGRHWGVVGVIPYARALVYPLARRDAYDIIRRVCAMIGLSLYVGYRQTRRRLYVYRR